MLILSVNNLISKKFSKKLRIRMRLLQKSIQIHVPNNMKYVSKPNKKIVISFHC